MSKVFKENSEIEKALQTVEDVMREQQIIISSGLGGLTVRYKDTQYNFININTSDHPPVQELPRETEEEKIEFPDEK